MNLADTLLEPFKADRIAYGKGTDGQTVDLSWPEKGKSSPHIMHPYQLINQRVHGSAADYGLAMHHGVMMGVLKILNKNLVWNTHSPAYYMYGSTILQVVQYIHRIKFAKLIE